MKNFAITVLSILFLAACGGEKSEQSSSSNSSETANTTNTADPDSVNKARAVEQASFVDLQGNPVSLEKFKGKVVLIDFWETWCKPCLASFSTMQQLMDDYPDQFVVLAVTPGFTDSREDARKFAQSHNYDFVYLYDENKLHQKLGVYGIPYKVFVGPQGNFIEASLGSDGPKGDYKHAKEIIEEHT